MRRMGGLESDAHREKYKGENMFNIAFITSKVNEMSASLTTLNRIAIFLVAAAAIAVAFYFVASYFARNMATRLDNAKDELIRLENREQTLRITRFETDSEEHIARVKAEIEERITLLTAEAAKAGRASSRGPSSRYAYLSPAKPARGNRAQAQRVRLPLGQGSAGAKHG